MTVIFAERKQEGITMATDVLQVEEPVLIEARLMDRKPPLFLVMVQVQQIHCVKNRDDEIVEGGESEIRAAFYLFCMQRMWDEETSTLQWKLLEMQKQADMPYY